MEHLNHAFKSLREDVSSQIARKRSELNRSAQLGIEAVPENDIRFFIDGIRAAVRERLKPDEHQRALEAATHEARDAVRLRQTAMEEMRAKVAEHRHREYVFYSQEVFSWKSKRYTSLAKAALGLAEGVNVYYAFAALFPYPAITISLTLCFPIIFVFVTSAVAKGIRLCGHWHTKAIASMAALASAVALFYSLASLREIVMLDSGGTVIPEWLSVVISVFFFAASVFINLMYEPTETDLRIRHNAEREGKAAEKLEKRMGETSAEMQKASQAASVEAEGHRRYLAEAGSYDAFLENAAREMAQSYRNEYNLFNSKNAANKSISNHNHLQTQLT